MNVDENWILSSFKKRNLSFYGHIKQYNDLEKDNNESIAPKKQRGSQGHQSALDITDILNTKLTNHN